LPFYGFDKDTAPNLQRFSNECFVFSDAIAQSGSTSISLAALFSSRYPITDNLMTDRITLKKNRLFLPYLLKRDGYNTYAIVRDDYATSRHGFNHGFDHFDEDFTFESNNASKTFDSAIALTKEMKEPFFLWIHNEEPHSPYLPPEKYFREFYQENRYPTVYSFLNPAKKAYEVDEEKYRDFHNELLSPSENADLYHIYGLKMRLGEEELKQLKARYLGNIKYADENFGRFLTHLKSYPFYKNTIMVITADHGESLGAHHLFDHNDVFQEIIQVPLLLHLPGQNFRRIIAQPVELVDIYPTLLELLGLRVGTRIRGEHLLQGERQKSFQLSEYPWKKALVKDKIKYVWDKDVFYSYNLDLDPAELEMILEEKVGKIIFEIPRLPADIFFESKEEIDQEGSRLDIGKSLELSPRKEMHVGSQEFHKFRLTEFLELRDKKVLTFTEGKDHLKIEVTKDVGPELIPHIIRKELFRIKAVYGKSFSPYPAQLSREIECSKDLMPIYYEAQTGEDRRTYLLTFSNERFGIGVCSRDLVAFRHLIGWIYCPQKKELHKVRYFIPVGEPDEKLVMFFTGLTCRH
jgi:arylsulfatase